MSLESVRRFFAEKAPDLRIIELETSTATVALAAEAHGVEPGRIAKTLSLRVGERTVLVVARGDAGWITARSRPPSAARRRCSAPRTWSS